MSRRQFAPDMVEFLEVDRARILRRLGAERRIAARAAGAGAMIAALHRIGQREEGAGGGIGGGDRRRIDAVIGNDREAVALERAAQSGGETRRIGVGGGEGQGRDTHPEGLAELSGP